MQRNLVSIVILKKLLMISLEPGTEFAWISNSVWLEGCIASYSIKYLVMCFRLEMLCVNLDQNIIMKRLMSLCVL